MNIRYTFRRVDPTPALRAYIEKKFEKVVVLAHRYHESPSCAISLHRGTQHREGEVFEITVNMNLGTVQVNNVERAADVYAAIDKMESELARQLQKKKEKPITKRNAGGRALKDMMHRDPEDAGK